MCIDEASLAINAVFPPSSPGESFGFPTPRQLGLLFAYIVLSLTVDAALIPLPPCHSSHQTDFKGLVMSMMAM